MMEAFAAVAALGVGVLIGACGIGGVLLVSFFALSGMLGIHEAAATSLFSFIFTGVLGTWLFQRKGNIAWSLAVPVCVGALIASYAGTALAATLDARKLSLIVGAVIVLAGFNMLLPRRAPVADARPAPQGTLSLLAIGAASGFGSGLSGAGGPVFSVPLMIALRHSALAAIGIGQVLQVVAAGAGSVGNASSGLVDWRLALWVAAFQLLGVTLGVRLAHSVNEKWLKALAGSLCLIAGGLLALRAA